MARMYEMNLMIRLQDRASARMRRIAGDMSAMNRHAQAQNRLQKLRMDAGKTEVDIQKKMAAATELTNRRSEIGERNVARRATAEARLFRAQQVAYNRTDALERAHWSRLDAAGRKASQLSAQQKSALLGLESAQANLNAETIRQVTARKAINAEIAREIALLNKINAEIAARAPLEAAGMAAARRHQQGRALTHGGSLAFMGGAVAVGASAVAAGSFAKFNVQVAKAATQVGNTNLGITASINQTREATDQLQTKLLGMAKQFPATAEEMASSLYNVFSSMDLGNSAAERMTNGLLVLQEANKAAVGGQVDLATATDTLITVFNDFDPDLNNMHQNMSELFSIVRFMRGGFDELSAGMNKLAPAARQANQRLIDVGAAFAVVTQAIPSAAQSSTAVARLMDLFGSKDFIAGMKRAGEDITMIGADGSRQLKPLYDIMQNIVNLDPSLTSGGPKLTQLVKELTQFGSATGKGGSKGLIQMQRALTVLFTEHAKHNEILKQAREDTVEYDKSVQILAETADVKWKIAMNNLRVAWIQFGQSAMPVLLTLLEVFSKALNAFNGLSSGTRKWLGVLTVVVGLLATFGGLMASAFGGVMMIVATKRLWAVEKALKAIAVANGEVAATSVGANKGIVGMGKGALKTAGWLGVVVLAFETLKGAVDEFHGQNVEGNVAQKFMRGWASQFKSANAFLADFVGQGDEVRGAWDSIFNAAPTIFGKATEKMKNQSDTLTKTEKENDSVVVKSAKSKLDQIIKINAAAAESDKKLAAWQKRLAKATTEARQAALKQQKADVEAAAKNLTAKYKELEAANDSAIGSILGGPISGGPILSAFASINQTLMGVGVKPIKVPVQFLMQDAENQLANFDMWRGALSKLAKKVPPLMLEELRGAGIEKLPEVLSLADAGPQFLAQYVKVWKDTKTARDAATKADMDSTLGLWNSYGKDVAWQIVNGLVDSGAEAKIYEGFTKMITTTFAGQLKKTMDDAVAEAVASWIESNPKPKPVKPSSPKALADAETALSGAQESAAAARETKILVDAYTNSPAGKALAARWEAMADFYGGGKNKGIGGKGGGGGGGGAWATGGVIGGSGRGDTVPAWLTPGEVVLNRRQIANMSAKLGTANDPHAVFKSAQHFADGGVASRFKKWALTGEGGLIPLGTSIAKSFTPSGLKQQGREMVEGFRHPLRRIQAGGNMEFPGGKGIFKDPGAATTRAALEARKAELASKRSSMGKHKGIMDYIGVKELSKEELDALDERIARDAGYTGPANQMPDHAVTRANRVAAEKALLMKRRADKAKEKSLTVEKHKANINKSVKTTLDSGRKILSEYDKFVPNWESTIRNYPETAADFAGSFVYHAKAANKRIETARKSAASSKSALERLDQQGELTGPWATGSKKPAAAIPGTAGMLKSLRDAKKAQAATSPSRKRVKPTAKQTGEAKSIERIIGPITVERIAEMRAKTAEALRRAATEERGQIGSKNVNLPKQDLFSEVGRVEAKKMLDKLKATKSPGKLKGYAAGGWVPGTGQGDKVPAFLTPGEFVVSKPMINSLTNNKSTSGSSSTSNDIHVTVQASNPTEQSILNALKPVLFSLRHSR